MPTNPADEQVRAEESVHEDESLYSILVPSINNIVWEADPETFRFTFVSRQAEQILGYPVEQWVSEPDFWRRHTHPDDVEWCTAFCADSTVRGRDHVFEYRMIAADGRVVWLRDIATLTRGDDGPARLRGVMIDISERKRTEEALRESEKRYRQLLETTQEGVWILDAQGRTTYINPRMTEMLGHTVGEMTGRHANEFVDVELREEARRHFPARREGLSEQFDFRFRRKDGSDLWAIVAASPLYDEGGGFAGSLLMVTDITERKRLEEHLAQAQKMEAVGRLAGGIAHDFNNLLTVINGYSQVLLSRLEEGHPMRRQLGEIERAGRRAAELTRQLLAFSRKQILQPKVLDLNEAVAESARMIRRLIGEDVELVIDLAPELGRIKADPGQIEQIAVNLAVNARDAMPRGGKLTLRTANLELDEEEASRFGEVGPGPYVLFAVSDTGGGLSEEVRPHIFEPFFTTKEKGKGTGLGLATVYGIVKQSGGEIRVTSAVGEGTTFEIVFPRVRVARAAGEHAAGEGAPPPPGTETVLLVEDEELVRGLAREFLESNGYTVLEAPNGGEALKVAARHGGPVHLLLTDVVMPRMSGRELAEQIRRTRPQVRVLYTSGYTDEAIVHHGVLDEGLDFLHKPFTLEALAQKVREVLDR